MVTAVVTAMVTAAAVHVCPGERHGCPPVTAIVIAVTGRLSRRSVTVVVTVVCQSRPSVDHGAALFGALPRLGGHGTSRRRSRWSRDLKETVTAVT